MKCLQHHALDEVPTAPRPTNTVFVKGALYSGGMAIGSGHMNAHVVWSENTTEDNPIMLVKGTDVDGRQFEVEVAVNNVNPKNASIIELFALNGYYGANGMPQIRLLNATQSGSDTQFLSQQDVQNIRDRANAFTPINFLDALSEMMETQRYHGNLNGYLKYRGMVESLMGFPRE